MAPPAQRLSQKPDLGDMEKNGTLITGALGFVGIHLTRTLLRAGVPVIGAGRHNATNPLPAQVADFTQQGPVDFLPGAVLYAGEDGEFLYLPCALEDATAVTELVTFLQPAMIYHLAAQSSAGLSFREPVDTFNSNVNGTLNLLEAMRSLPPSQRPIMLSVGSCEEYGPHPDAAHPLTENTPLNPISPYAVSKVTQTLLCRQYVRAWDLPIITVRAFSHTGPGQDTRFAFPSFARQIAAAEVGQGPTEILTGNLSPVRDFLDVRDVICAYRTLMKEGLPGEIYNVSSGRALTILEGLEIMIQDARVPITLKQDPDRMRPADIQIMVGNNSKLCHETGWTPDWEITRTLLALLEEARKEFA